MQADPTGPSALFMTNMGGFNPNSRDARAAEIGSATGVSNGRGLADLYAPLANGGALNGMRLVGQDTLTRMGQVSVAIHEDATLMIPTRFSLGFMKPSPALPFGGPQTPFVYICTPTFTDCPGARCRMDRAVHEAAHWADLALAPLTKTLVRVGV